MKDYEYESIKHHSADHRQQKLQLTQSRKKFTLPRKWGIDALEATQMTALPRIREMKFLNILKRISDSLEETRGTKS